MDNGKSSIANQGGLNIEGRMANCAYHIRHTRYDILDASRHATEPVLLLSRILYKSPLFLQNEPKFRKSQMNVNKVLTMNYEKKDTWWTGKKRTQTNPKRTQYEPNTNPNKPKQACPEQRRMDPISQRSPNERK